MHLSPVDLIFAIHYSAASQTIWSLEFRLCRIHVSSASQDERITPPHNSCRIDRYWLPIRVLASFKILVFAHKVIHNSKSALLHLSSFSTTKYNPDTRNNRVNKFDCVLTTVGARSICITLRALWDSLPVTLTENLSLAQPPVQT